MLFRKSRTAGLSRFPFQSTVFEYSTGRAGFICSYAIDRPTVDARAALYATAQKQAEESKVQLRKMEQASVKKGKYEKHSVELEAVRYHFSF